MKKWQGKRKKGKKRETNKEAGWDKLEERYIERKKMKEKRRKKNHGNGEGKEKKGK